MYGRFTNEITQNIDKIDERDIEAMIIEKEVQNEAPKMVQEAMKN